MRHNYTLAGAHCKRSGNNIVIGVIIAVGQELLLANVSTYAYAPVKFAQNSYLSALTLIYVY